MKNNRLKALSIAASAVLSAVVPQFALAATTVLPTDLSTWTCTGNCGAMAAAGDIVASPLNSPKYGYVTTFNSSSIGVSPLALDSNSRGNGTETNGSKFVSSSFSVLQNDQLNIHFNYISTDGKGFDDYAWARLVNASDSSFVAWLFTARSSNSATGNIVPGDVVRKEDFDPDTTITNYKDFSFTSKTSSDPVNWSPLGSSNGTCWRDNAPGCGFSGWLQSSHTFASGGTFKLEIGVTNWGDTAYDSGLAFDFQNLNATNLAPVPEPSTYLMFMAGLGMIGLGARRSAQRRTI